MIGSLRCRADGFLGDLQRSLLQITFCALSPCRLEKRVISPLFAHYGRTCAINRLRDKSTLASASATKARLAFFASPR